MARAIIARRNGDEYQARVFWLHLLKLRTSDFVDIVTLESDRVAFTDDVTVKYRIPIVERATGLKIDYDYFQCKYHVTQGGSFTYNNLLNPDFVGGKESMLKRLYDAFLTIKKTQENFRLYIFSNWHWHPDDEIANHLHEESIRNTFFQDGTQSKTGLIRKAFIEHLKINSDELELFLKHVRFRLGKDLIDLARELEPRLKLANLMPIDPTTTNIIYDDLTWKLFEQGKNSFNRETFNDMIQDEKLVVVPDPTYSEISICSFPQFARRPRDFQAAHLDLSALFEGRFVRQDEYWVNKIPNQIVSFFKDKSLTTLPQPLHLFFDCHLSIAFFIGTLINPKYGLQIVPAEKTRALGYEFWSPATGLKTGLWKVSEFNGNKKEAIIGISVTNPIENQLINYLTSTEKMQASRFLFEPLKGIGPTAISDGDYAWYLAYELQNILRNKLSPKCEVMHLFIAAPVAFAYIIGNTLRSITPRIQLYEHDYEGQKIDIRYFPSICLPVSAHL